MAILACFAVVIALTLVLERVAFRPLRGTSPATMLVATFAISFLLRSIYLLAFGSRGEVVGTLGGLNTAVSIGSLRIRWISIVALVVGGAAPGRDDLLLNRTTIGLHIRAAAADFRTARIVGVRANRVIVFSFAISGVLAAAVAVILTVQSPLVTPDFGVQVTIFALVGVVVGGLDRLLTATLGGFAIGFATSFLGARLPSESSVYLPSMIYGLVILVLLSAPAGSSRGRGRPRRSGCESRLEPLVSLLAPAALVVAVAVIGSQTGLARQLEFENALVNTSIVVALYVFIGNSGVISFGHISFVAVGAFLAGILTLEAQQKDFVLPEMFPLLRHAHVGIVQSLAIAAVGRRDLRARRRHPADAALGAPGRHRHLRRARHHLQRAQLLAEDRPRRDGARARPRERDLDAHGRRADRDRASRSPTSAARSDACCARRARIRRRRRRSGIDVHRQRLYAFVISGALAGFAGGLLVHELGSITTQQVYLDLTFLTLAMLVVGGVASLWGAVVGALLVSGLDSFLNDAEQGVHVGFHLTLPTGRASSRSAR